MTLSALYLVAYPLFYCAESRRLRLITQAEYEGRFGFLLGHGIQSLESPLRFSARIHAKNIQET